MDEVKQSKPTPTVHTASEVLLPKRQSSHHPFIYIWVMMIIVITGISGYLTYRNVQLQNKFSAPTSFIECTNAPESIIREMSPPICMTRDGVQFTQPQSQ